jgi:hypothetical protein
LIANLTQGEIDTMVSAATRFVNTDIPALNNLNMRPTLTIRYASHALTKLSAQGCGDFAPSPSDV